MLDRLGCLLADEVNKMEENNNTNLEGTPTDKSNQGPSDVDLAIENVIAGGQAEISSLKKEIEDLKIKLRTAEREGEKYQEEAKRESKKTGAIIEEKRVILDKLKNLQSMHDGVDEETAREVLKRAREGEGSDFETEKARLVDSAINEFKEMNYNPILDELQEAKDTVAKFKKKLHNAVVKSEIINNAIKYGVNPELAEYVVPEFESRLTINEDGDRVYLNSEGYQSPTFDWKGNLLVLKSEKPSLFLRSTGSGAKSAASADILREDINPWVNTTRSRTAQMKIMSADPAKAAKLKDEADKINKKNRK